MALERPQTPAEAPSLLNAGEMCRALGRSRAWLDTRLVEDPDFPVVSRGGKGQHWQFDRDAVVEHVNRTEETRQGLLRGVLTPQGRLAEAKAQMVEMEVAERMGRLIDAEELELALGSIFAALGSTLGSLCDQIVRRHGLSEAAKIDIGEMFDTARREFVAAASGAATVSRVDDTAA